MTDLKPEIEKIVKKRTRRDHIIGYSYLEGLVPKKYSAFDYGITVGVRLDDKIMNKVAGGPTPEYLKHYHAINSSLNKIALDIKSFINEHRRRAEIIPATLETSEEDEYPNYLQTLSVDFSHKIAATRSGLGWIGKTALFVSPILGPRLRLVTVLTTMKFDTGEPVKTSLCGQCDTCVTRCPAGAANGKLWSVDVHRDEFYNAHACRNMAKELTKTIIKKDETVCGICVAVCPLGGKG
jgi:epoxyqueuosine reductase QueG